MPISQADLAEVPEPREPRLRAAAVLEATGLEADAAAAGGCTPAELAEWRRSPWWPIASAYARESFDSGLQGRLAAIAEAALKKLDERLEHGDEVVTKDGAVVAKAVPAGTLAIIAGVAIDKRQLVAGKPTEIRASTRLGAIADLLAQAGRAPTAPVPEAAPLAPSDAADCNSGGPRGPSPPLETAKTVH